VRWIHWSTSAASSLVWPRRPELGASEATRMKSQNFFFSRCRKSGQSDDEGQIFKVSTWMLRQG
jgi:hypothetical protein